jgi:hypothetical protein
MRDSSCSDPFVQNLLYRVDKSTVRIYNQFKFDYSREERAHNRAVQWTGHNDSDKMRAGAVGAAFMLLAYSWNHKK